MKKTAIIHDSRKKRHVQTRVYRRLSVQHAYRRTTERRATDLMKAKKTKTKRNNTTKYTSWRRLWLIDFRERTSTSALSLGYPLFCPFCHVRTHATAYRSPAPAFSAVIQLTMKRSVPCSVPLAPSHLVLGYARPLVGVNTESSEVIQEVPCLSISCPPPQPAPPPFRTSRNSAISCPPCAPQIPQIVSASVRIIPSTLSLPVFMRVFR